MVKKPKVIVAENLSHFCRICEENGWKPYQIKFVSFQKYSDNPSVLYPYFEDDIYPSGISGRPKKPDTL